MNRILRLTIMLTLLLIVVAACVSPMTGEYLPPLFVSPTPTPTASPTPLPTNTPTDEPTVEPKVEPTQEPTATALPEPEAAVESTPDQAGTEPAQLDPDSPLAPFVVESGSITLAALGVEVTQPGPDWLLVDAEAMGLDFGGMTPLAMLLKSDSLDESGESGRYVTYASFDVPDFSIRALYQILQADPETGLAMLSEEMGDVGEDAQITQVGPYNAVLIAAPNPLGDINYLWIVVRPSQVIYILAEGFPDSDEAAELVAAATGFLTLEGDAEVAKDLLPNPDDPEITPAEQRERLVVLAQNVRNLESREEVDFNFMNEDALRDVLEGDEEPQEEDLRQDYGEERMLKLLGLVPEDVDLLALLLDLYQSQIAGYYDDETNEFVLIDESAGAAETDGETTDATDAGDAGETSAAESADPEANRLDLMAQITFIHEYVHALQDQYFDLARFSPQSNAQNEDAQDGDAQTKQPDDAILAVRALVEGDAQFATSLYIVDYVDLIALYKLGQESSDGAATGAPDGVTDEGNTDAQAENPAEPDLDVETEVGMEGEVNVDLLDEAPNFVRESLIFPYMAGELFILAIYDESGWEGVNGVWDNPPVSTEQILHPELYPDDVPTPVTLPDDLAALLSQATGGEWEEFVRNVWGEFQLRTMLAEQLSETMASRGADGWDGDLFAYLADGETELVVMSTVWDSSSEARQARTAWQEWLDRSGYDSAGSRRYTHLGDEESGSPARYVFITGQFDAVYFLLSTDADALEAAIGVLGWE